MLRVLKFASTNVDDPRQNMIKYRKSFCSCFKMITETKCSQIKELKQKISTRTKRSESLVCSKSSLILFFKSTWIVTESPSSIMSFRNKVHVWRSKLLNELIYNPSTYYSQQKLLMRSDKMLNIWKSDIGTLSYSIWILLRRYSKRINII